MEGSPAALVVGIELPEGWALPIDSRVDLSKAVGG